MRHARTVAALSTDSSAQPQQLEQLRRAVLVMRVQAWAAFAGALAAVALFFWTIGYSDEEHNLVGVVLIFAAWCAGLGAVLLLCARALQRGASTATRAYAIAAELVVLLTMWWLWPLFLVTVIAPAYVIAMLVRTHGAAAVAPG